MIVYVTIISILKLQITHHYLVWTISQMCSCPILSGMQKNLFIRDHKREHYYLITVRGSKRVDLKQFRKDHKLKKISFGSEEELWNILKIKPGHVSPFCLLHDEERKVHYYIDADYENNLIGIHPNQNDATVWLQGKELVKLIEEHGTTIEYITI